MVNLCGNGWGLNYNVAIAGSEDKGVNNMVKSTPYFD